MNLEGQSTAEHTGAFGILVLVVCLLHGLALKQLSAHMDLGDTGAPPVAWLTRQVDPIVSSPAALTQPSAAKTKDRQKRPTGSPEPLTPPANPPTATAQNADLSPASEDMTLPKGEPATPPADSTQLPTPEPAELVRQVERLRPAAQFVVPASARLSYRVTGESKGLNYSANSELLWQHDGVHYDARLVVSAFLLGSRSQTSRGTLTPEGLEPTRFADKVRSEQAAHFERSLGKIVFSANAPAAALLSGAQDRLSVLLQLSSMFAGNSALYPPATTLSVQVVSAREAEVWLLTVGELETLQLPGGEVQAVKLTRNPRRVFDQTAELWLAPSMGYLPVRLRITQSNGDFVDQQWRASAAP